MLKESKALRFENQVIGNLRNKKPKEHIEAVDLNMTQTSDLSPQSSNLSPDNFSQVCTDLLDEGYQVKFKAPGDSMYPTICDGDLITVEPVNPSDVILGDIILYHHSSGIVAHRVVRIETPQSSALSVQHCFILRGDAAINNDDPIRADQILGKVSSIERNGRHLDPYCPRLKLLYKARRLAVRLKRFLSSPDSNSA